MAIVTRFTEEQARLLVNLRQHYEVWLETERALVALPYDLRRKDVNGHVYLYEINDRSGNGRSLGPWSDAQAARFEAYRAEKTALKARRETSRAVLDGTARVARALRVPMLANE